MLEDEVKHYISIKMGFSPILIKKLEFYSSELIKYNYKYNLISKSTESIIWHRHILDSAQIIKFIDISSNKSLSDLGSGAGLPGLVISILSGPSFHVKLYEKSPVKCKFLEEIVYKLDLNCKILSGDYRDHNIQSNFVTARAFKKLPEIIKISREIIKKPHKMIILKGKSAQDEINNALKTMAFKYKLEDSITDKKSKILIIDA